MAAVQHHRDGGNENLQLGAKRQKALRLDRTAADVGTRELSLRRARLEAIAARLKAEENAAERIEWPAYLTERRGDAEVEAVMRSQDSAFTSSRRKLESDLAMLAANVEAFRFRVRGYELQAGSMRRQLVLLREENAAKTRLLARGLVRRPDINVLRRPIAEIIPSEVPLIIEVQVPRVDIDACARASRRRCGCRRSTSARRRSWKAG